MSEPSRLSILTVQNQAWPEMLRRWLAIEAMGFDGAWVADHFVSPRLGYEGDPFLECWTLLAALSAATRTIRVGTLVTSVTLHKPAVLARQAMTVDHISAGRLDLGIGPGGSPADQSMTGTEPWTRAERTARWREMVEILDRLLRQRETTYVGRYYRVDAALMDPPPVQRPRPRLVLPAHGPIGLRLVAEYADTWNTMTAADFADVEVMTILQRVAAVREQSAMLDGFCDEIGRDPRTIRRSVMAQEPMSNVFRSVGFFEDYVGAFREAGVEDFVFFWPTPYGRTGDVDAAIAREERIMEQVAADVLPRLRTLAGAA
jgi:alkanesulfonate monooxygenase SsuD/methylene tetrahydromethanopterin reductase-like flavin-dependent oxidoreductase (luciferase family)